MGDTVTPFRVEYTVRYTRVVDCIDLADAERRMRAFRGTRPEGEIKIVSIYAVAQEEEKKT